ncbi:MAG: hypothetical protein M3Y87_16270 [Myxococcota bacterium]|nr:hypothetical protein [Myxococcota bacterium]
MLFAIVIAASTSGCATLFTGIACAAGSCPQGALAQAAEVDLRIGGAILEAASSSSRTDRSSSGGESASVFPARPQASPEAAAVAVTDASDEREVRVDFEDDERHLVRVFPATTIGGPGGRKPITVCETPCRLTLAPDVYGISVDASLVRPLQVDAWSAPDPSSAPIEFVFRSHEPRRIQGWTMIGSAVSAFALLTVTSIPMTEALDEELISAHLIGTSLGLFSMLIAGVILAIWPDELDAQVSW